MLRSVIVDTSVLVSAFLFPDSIPGRVLALAGEGAYPLHVSPIIREEVKRSLHNPRLRKSYACSDEKIWRWLADLDEIGTPVVKPLPDIGSVCRDPDDDHVLAAAVLMKAEFIVTGDKDLLALGQYKDTRIVSAKAFLEEIG
jgi:putative PIN family toxin of toxin-antitoxin system